MQFKSIQIKIYWPRLSVGKMSQFWRRTKSTFLVLPVSHRIRTPMEYVTPGYVLDNGICTSPMEYIPPPLNLLDDDFYSLYVYIVI